MTNVVLHSSISSVHSSLGFSSITNEKASNSSSYSSPPSAPNFDVDTSTPPPFSDEMQMQTLEDCFMRRMSGFGKSFSNKRARGSSSACRKVCSPLENMDAEFEYVEFEDVPEKRLRQRYNEIVGKMIMEELLG
mmetsp:Transcript_61646/g.145271  ORF Transcript_61646/g.145271 Transcript_61646/m.145271 type:complete len:134 (-) Transcript_61646:87-488(-)|eukprot:CAMPEP_0177710016 /NCGR_PEP_ID=MMETSP0484_2-20121128/11109_1 /TAXON_ID=354590 /ORGANISM="Rhodomonas lens, Strain RHODO" /LENGTH=133 /DNA_ID=CAMNT_0019221667 /DNA_START=177 /DNA_END=578 /DNA_ORIENTATION=-